MNAFKLTPLSLVFVLAACVSPQKQPELNQLHQEVGKLNHQMQQLTRQASTLEQQNSLNSSAAQGAWLLPAANAPVILQSQAGDLRLSLSNIDSEANGTRALLHFRVTGDSPLSAFSAQVEWGELDDTTGKPLQATRQSTEIAVPNALLPQSEATVALRLSNLSPSQLGYVRIHDVVITPAP